MSDYSILFKPFTTPKLHFPGRVTMAPMTRFQCLKGVPGQNVADYYHRRANNDVGFIMSEGITIDHPTASPSCNVPSLSTHEAREGWKNVVSTVHGAGSKMGCQLWHAGTIRVPADAPNPDCENSAVSAVSGFAGTPLSDEAIQDIVDAYVRSACCAVNAGFDAIEIHCAHGYLLDQFLWSTTNLRAGRWGGAKPEERAALPVEVVRQVRREVGEDFPIFARLSQWKQQDFEARLWNSPKELETIMGLFVDAGVDIFDCSLRRYWEPEYENSTLNLAGWIKRLTGKPTMAVGSVGLEGDFLTAFLRTGTVPASLDNLVKRMEEGEFDLIAVGRALMNDPAWLAKVRNTDNANFLPMPEDVMDRYW